MIRPPFHSNEESRLEALRHLDILDTSAEERYDRITRLAKRLFHVPIVLVSLVDKDRLWYKSVQGLEVSETPRDISFCGHAILAEDPLVIEDAVHDHRFHDNPLVTGDPKIRFYAGHPLKSFSGLPMGMLCLIDHVPRKLSGEEQQVLADLAALVEAEFNKDAVRHFGLDKIIHVTPLGLAVVDRYLKIVYANRRLEKEFGYGRGELMGAEINRLLSEPCRENFSGWATILFGDSKAMPSEQTSREFSGLKKDGEEFLAEVSLNPLATDAGTFVVVSVLDITVRKAAERKIQELIQVKSNFISIVTHELRTPLTSIKESIELVREEVDRPLTANQKKFLTIAERNVRRLSGLINSVLDYQKFNAGKMTFNFKPNDLNRAAEEVVKSLETQARKKEILIRTKFKAGTGLVYFDYDRIVQVIFNLLHNAIKFTEKGEVIIAVGREKDSVRLWVSDCGIGVRPEDREKLFQPFGQIRANSKRSVSGTGLGLAISKSIMEAHGGEIGFDSTEGEGSRFWISLPVRRGSVPGICQDLESSTGVGKSRAGKIPVGVAEP